MMGWDETGVEDLEDIPNYFQVHWKFLNAFFKAFQERAYYTEQSKRPSFFDDLILDAPQIESSELQSRLALFNEAVQTCWHVPKFPSGEPVGIMAEQWLKVETWDEFGGFTESLEANLVDEVYWGYDDLRAYLTPDVFDLILNFYEFKNNFNTTYWSGIYKLINLMEYNKLSISTFEAPVGVEPDDIVPILYCNDRETYPITSSSILSLDDLILDSIAESDITFGAGTKTITSGLAQYSSSATWLSDVGEQAAVEYDGMFSDPFIITPLQIDIRTKTKVYSGTLDIFDERGGAFQVWNRQDIRTKDPILSTRSEITVEGIPDPIIYTPDQVTYDAIRYQNLNMTVNFDIMTSENSLDKSGPPDIRTTQTVNTTPVPAIPDPPEDGILRNSLTREQNNDFELDIAISKIPLSALEYGPQIQ